MDKEQQAKLLSEIMEADARDELYQDISKMETTQTAMQQLIKWLEVGWKDEDIDSVIKKCNQLLVMEKEQIKISYETGWANGDLKKAPSNGKDYYNETYNK